MATLALAAAGAAVGGALLPTGLSVLGTTLTGAAIGSQIGAAAGSFVDQALFGASGQSRTFRGPRLSDLHVTASTEGAPVPRVYGRMRLGGQVIWATDIEEEILTTTQRSGSGKGRSGGASASAERIEYRYYGNFAVALAEGPISGVGRIWADGSELDLSGVNWRLYTGTEDQSPDSLIVTREGPDNAPAYRGVAYIVFEHMPLAPFGNRIPQLSFEISRAVDELHDEIRGVVLIPGSGEFAYAPSPVTRIGEGGARVYENVRTRQGGTDWQVALDQLEASLPNARSVSLVVSWFGTDLRAEHCEVRPGVDALEKNTYPAEWRVAGLARADAHLVSLHDGRPAYGGTPSDASVVAAIQDLTARGISVVLNPFILMDIPEGNALPDPHGGASQPAYPWRGRIGLDPAPGLPGSADKTALAAAQIASFVGTASVNDFTLSGTQVIYAGPDEWSFRRQVLHYAWLAKAAGGVDAFVLGSELRSLTQARDSAASYPFVAALAALVSDVKSVLGSSTKATYAADWSEYFGHQPSDGSGDVYFNLDPLWSSPDIDAVGIDLYWPLSDWRNGREHLDAMAGASSIYDLDYLKSNIAGGEGYDWYYASPADRALQDRTPIADGYGKPWVFRYKDLASWWSNRHFDRPDGVEAASPTAWIAGSKPVWLLECGCPAVDKGANQPNVFVDPKSAESVLPYFSDGRRDDLIQRRYLQALVEAFDPDHPDHVPGLNPVSTVYGSVMVDPARIYAYAWDARPYPAFPNDIASWGDGGNWRLGHWLNGRVAGAPLADVVGAILDDSGFTAYDTRRLEGVVSGYAIDRIMSAREALQPLELSFFFDAVESEGRIVFRHRGADAPVATVESDTMVEPSRSSFPFTLTRGQESELPSVAKIAFVNAAIDYRQGIAEARRIAAGTGRTAQADLAIALEPEVAEATAQVWLYETWIARERASFSLGPTHLAVEPGDLISIHHGETDRLYRVTAVSERGEREIEALAIDPELYAGVDGAARGSRIASPPTAGQPLADFIDLPLLRGNEPDEAGYVAASQTPWPGAVAFYSAPGVTGYSLAAVAAAPATTGMTLDALPAGRGSRIDNGARFRVKLDRGELASATRLGLLAGDNVAAMRTGDGEWEVIQFETATLQSPGIYELSGLLRGQAGTEGAILVSLAAGARFVLINDALARIDLASAQVGLPLNWRYGPADRDLGDESYAAVTHSFRGVGRRPLSPVHVHGRRADGNLFMHWIRRTRIESDSWDAVAVPLGEDLESYEIDILSAGTVIRTLASATTSATYTASQQTADFGSPQSEMDVRVYQLSAVWGRGTPAQAVL